MPEHEHADTSRLLLDAAPNAADLPRRLAGHGMRLFYGDLHNHTGYSDGTGRPGDALRQMRDRGLHFAAITDHGEFLDEETIVPDRDKWQAIARQVAELSGDDFVAIRGFEWSSPREGHSNVWWSAAYTGHFQTGDESMASYYAWLRQAEPAAGGLVLAGFNHPGRELVCFDGCAYEPALSDRIVTLECFNRDDDYGSVYFRALDLGWRLGAIGVSDHHGNDWGSPQLPRAGLLAPSLGVAQIQAALRERHVFATRSPTLALLFEGNGAIMGSRLALGRGEPLELGIWCHDSEANGDWTRLEVWTTGGTLVEARETRGLHQLAARITVAPRAGEEHWYVARVGRAGRPLAYSSPIWARWAPS